MSLKFLRYELRDIRTAADAFAAVEEAKRELESMRSRDFSAGVYIWGCGELGQLMAKFLPMHGVPVLGILDAEQTRCGLEIQGTAVEELTNKTKPIVATAFWNQRQIASSQRLGIESEVVSVWELLLKSGLSKPFLPWVCLRTPDHLGEEERQQIKRVEDRTEDASELARQLAARHFVGILDSNLEPTHRPDQEYFVSELWPASKRCCFVDVGAHSGDTIERFLNSEVLSRMGNIQLVAVEPDSSSFRALLDKFQSPLFEFTAIRGVLGPNSGLVEFSEHKLSQSSNVFGMPNTVVPMVTLDDLAKHFQITHIKIDVEGAEPGVLRGGQTVLKDKTCYWAIASYHRPEDLWSIPDFFDESYVVHLTSHAPRPWDTTLHFLRQL